MYLALLITAVCAASPSPDTVLKLHSPLSAPAEKFEAFKAVFTKSYEQDEEEAERKGIFLANDAYIARHNAKGDSSYRLGHNEFSDLTPEEFTATHLGLQPGTLRRQRFFDESLSAAAANAPASVDWNTAGAVTPVKNQASCGGCWSFSTTGSLEGAYYVENNHTLLSFSEQQLVSCDTIDSGCGGGLMDNAFDWLKKSGGICTEDSYPYTSGQGKNGKCKKTCTPVAQLTSYTDVPDEKSLVAAVAQQPVSIAIEADAQDFQLYAGGVFDKKDCGSKPDHAVLAVGYGTDGKDYWLVKNSWGASWGEKGFIRMKRGVGQCAIGQYASYPTGVKPTGTPPAPGPAPGPSPGPSPQPSCPGPKASRPKCKKDKDCKAFHGCVSCKKGRCSHRPRGPPGPPTSGYFDMETKIG